MKTISKLITATFLGLFAMLAVAAGQVNINTADAQTLAAELKGVGEKKAQAIIDHRAENGRFGSVAEITEVSGIGDVTLEDNADRITVKDGE